MFFLAGSVDIANYANDNTPNTIEKTNIKLNKIRNSVVNTFLMLPWRRHKRKRKQVTLPI